VLRCLPSVKDPDVLAGCDDNAAVYRLSDELAIVQTVDFITPVVDDPYQFGAIAAANALSDIYAMGGRPVIALNLVGFPSRSIPLSILESILQGGADKAAEAGVSIVGGHSVNDHAPKYGLVVTGLVDPRRMITKKGARPGDALILTKPLGIGVITTGIDWRMVDCATEERVVRLMGTLNRQAAGIMQEVGVDACTDITGFGLLGHLREMLSAGNVGARIEASRVPLIPETVELLQAGAVSGGTHNNYRFLRDLVEWDPALSKEMKLALCDAQTSGGLLIAVARERREQLLDALRADPDVPVAAEIGEVIEEPGVIEVIT
jgi:selenide,water dikinase